MLKVLLSGENCHAYNISNPDSIITVKQLGEMLSKAGGVQLKIELPTEAEKKGFNPVTGKEEIAERRALKVEDELPLHEEYSDFVAGLLASAK